HDHRDRAVDQLSRQDGKTRGLIVCPAIIDRDVAALDVAGFVQALTESRKEMAKTGFSAVAKKPDHRHCRLLRARGKRTRRRAGEQRDELAPLHIWLPPLRSNHRTPKPAFEQEAGPWGKPESF